MNIGTNFPRVCVTAFALLLFIATSSFAQDAMKDDSTNFAISKKDIKHGDVVIRIFEQKRIRDFENSPHSCRTWFEVIKQNNVIFKKNYDDIDAVGFSYGIFVPKAQPPSHYFSIVKEGDYDGRLFLIRTDGKVFDLMGGFYFFSKDKRYLFSEYSSDMEGLEVFDLKAGKVVFSSNNYPSVHQWYEKDGAIFYTSEWVD